MAERILPIKNVLLVPGLGDHTSYVRIPHTTAAEGINFESNGEGLSTLVMPALWHRRTSFRSLVDDVTYYAKSLADSSGLPVGGAGTSGGGLPLAVSAAENPGLFHSVIPMHSRLWWPDRANQRPRVAAVNEVLAEGVDLFHENWTDGEKYSSKLGDRITLLRTRSGDNRVPIDAMNPGDIPEVVFEYDAADHDDAIFTLITSEPGVRRLIRLMVDPTDIKEDAA